MNGAALRGNTPVVAGGVTTRVVAGGRPSLMGSVSSAVSTYFVLTVRPSAVAVSVPAPPACPAEQFSDGLIAPFASVAIVPVGSVRVAGAAACCDGVSDAEAGLAKSTP